MVLVNKVSSGLRKPTPLDRRTQEFLDRYQQKIAEIWEGLSDLGVF